MRNIFFIGHFKTGSTSIQTYFARNWLGLMKKGVLSPAVESQAAARAMRLILQGRDEELHHCSLNIIEPHNALALRLKNEEDGHEVPIYYPHLPSGFQMFEMIGNQIERLEPQVLVLCSEVFALLGMTKERKSIERIHNRLGEYHTTLYCSLRRPDDYLSSWHRQRLKFGEKLLPLRGGALTNYLETAHFQHAKLVHGWLEGGFRRSQLIIRSFDEVQRKDGSVVDFLQQTGIPEPVSPFSMERMNPSVPAAFAEIGRLALHHLPQTSSSHMIDWLTSMRKAVPHHHDEDIEVFGPDARKILVEHYRPIAKELDVLAGGRKFSVNVDDLARLRPIRELEAARFALPGLVSASRKSTLDSLAKDWIAALDLPNE